MGIRGDGVSTAIQRAQMLPELDGIRAISIVFVLLVHISYGRLSGGFLGVDVFFVLSGYLITMLLLREYERAGSIHLGHFYMRRVLRILPPLVIAAALAIALTWQSETHARHVTQVFAVLGFYSNFMGPEVMGNLAHVWSLAVEEQFYLVWPVVLLIGLRFGRGVPSVCAVLVILAVIGVRYWMVVHVADRNLIYTFTGSRMDGIMLGCLLALVVPNINSASGTNDRKWTIVAWTSGAILFGALVFAQRDVLQALPLGFFLVAVISGAFILAVQRLRGGILMSVLCQPIVQWLGRRSYGLYLYHYPIFITLEAWRMPGNAMNFALVAVAKIILALAVTEFAWRAIEQPILQLKHRFPGARPR
jgi:peptidoglycan/LPS O-acetylase OafA/YrhL